MSYELISLACEKLTYREKLKLAQLLIQTAMKEEEEKNPDKRIQKKEEKKKENNTSENINSIDYIMERLLKLKPTKKTSLSNSIKAMFQFQGGISEKEINTTINKLVQKKFIQLDNNKVIYK